MKVTIKGINGVLLLTFCTMIIFIGCADAATYYVSTTGNDSNIGNLEYPWATLSRANQAISSGDTVIVRGGTYNSQGVTITKTNTTWQAYPGETPVFNGQDTYPGTDYGSIITIQATDVIWDGIDVTRAYSRCLTVNTGSHRTIVRNSEFSWSRREALYIYASTDVVVHSNDIHHGCTMKREVSATCGGWLNITSETPAAPAQLQIQNADRIHVYHNTVREGFWEGLGIYLGTDDAIIEKNIVYGNFRTQIYGTYSTLAKVRYNLIYGYMAMEDGCLRDRRGMTGIGVHMETDCSKLATYGSSASWDIYGNLIAGVKDGIWLGGYYGLQTCTPTNLPREIKDCRVYNNTVIMSYKYAGDNRTVYGLRVNRSGGGNDVRNNIFWRPGTLTTGEVIAFVDGAMIAAKGKNWWSALYPDADVADASDITTNNGDPGLEDGALNWHALTGSSGLTGGEFALSTGSACIGAGVNGTPISQDYDDGLNLRATNFPNRSFTSLDRDDYNGGAWSIGADVYATSGGVPGTVTGLSCTAVNAQRVNCSWSPVTGASSYKLYYKPNPGTCSTSGLTEIAGVTGTALSRENLIANQAYCWYAKATNSIGDSAAYSTVSEATTPAVSADLLNHLVSSLGLSGLTQTQGGTATVTTDGTSIRLYDPDSTSSPDNRAMISKTLGDIGGSWTMQFKATLTDSPATYSGSAPLRFIGAYAANGIRSNRVRITSEGIRVRDSAGDTLQSNTAQYVDTSEHTWLIQFDGATNQLTVKRDESTVATVSNAGSASTWEGGFGIEANGTAADPADISIKWMQVGNGIGAMTDPDIPLSVGAFGISLH